MIDTDYTCKSAGGVFVQLLPFADPEVIDKLEENAKLLSNVSKEFDKGLSNEDILKIALNGIEYDLFDELEVEYKCDCSYERTSRAVLSLGKKEVISIFDEQKERGEEEKLVLSCHFCNKEYEFTKEKALSLFE